MTKNTENNYNHIGHWSSHCTGIKFCDVKYKEYLKLIQKSRSERIYNNSFALRRYELWFTNAVNKVKRAMDAAKKIRACTVIQRNLSNIIIVHLEFVPKNYN